MKIVLKKKWKICPNITLAPSHCSQSEYVNDLLSKAVEIMNEDLAGMKQTKYWA